MKMQLEEIIEETPNYEEEECSMEDCFCPTSQAKRQKPPSPWRRLLNNGVLYLVVASIGFTFFCGVQIDHDTYYPASWYALR